MNEAEITDLFFDRNEEAIAVCRTRFGPLMRLVASRIIGRAEAELAENDAYLDAWNTIPPRRPESLSSYLAMLTRRRAIDMLKSRRRIKRGGAEYDIALDELSECVPSPVSVESEADGDRLRETLDSFLGALPENARVVFMRRYWWLESVKDIARDLGMGESAVKMQLARTRNKLREHLEKEGFEV